MTAIDELLAAKRRIVSAAVQMRPITGTRQGFAAKHQLGAFRALLETDFDLLALPASDKLW